jgi:integrase
MNNGIRCMRGKVQIRYQHAGRRYVEVLDGLKWSARGIEEATRIRDQRLERLRAGLPPIAETKPAPAPAGSLTFTFAMVAQLYLDHALAAAIDDPFRLKLSSRNSVRDLLNRYWNPKIGAMRIDAITFDDLKSAIRGITWTSTKRRRNAYGAVRAVFAYALDDDHRYITTNPAVALTTSTNKRRSVKRSPDAYTREERDALLQWLHTNASATVHGFYLLAFYSGMRTGELLALTWDDYDGESLKVDKARVRSTITTTKTDQARRVLLPAWICAAINGLPSRFRRRELFLTPRGEPYMRGAHLTEWFERAHTEAGIRRSKQPNYPWRHTYASLGLSAGVDPAFLAKQLGHTLAVFYSTYAAWISSDADRGKVESAFGEPSGLKSGLK